MSTLAFGTRAPAPQMVCHVGQDAIAGALPAWEELLGYQPSAPIFSRPAWAKAWMGSYGSGRTPHVLEVREGHRPVGILPLVLTRVAGVGLRRLEIIGASPATRRDWLLSPNGHGVAYYNDVLTAPGAENMVVCAVRQWLEQSRDCWDDLHLTSVPESSPLSRQFARLVAPDWHPTRSVERIWRTVDTSAGWDALRSTLKKRQARHLRYEPHALTRAAGAELVLEEVRGPGSVAAMEDFITLHDQRWARERKPGLTRGEAALYRELVAAGDSNFVVYRLVAGGTLLAVQFGSDYGDTYIPYNFTYNPEYDRQSPANVLLQKVIEVYCGRGMSRVDLIGLRHAERWSAVERIRVHLTARSPRLGVSARAAAHDAAGAALVRVQASRSGRRLRSGLAAAARLRRSGS